jgi:acylphosphatase
MPSIQIRISGKVQGVFYRAFVREHAIALRLKGWAENLPDGSVLVMAEGPDEDLDRLVHACRTGRPGQGFGKWTSAIPIPSG